MTISESSMLSIIQSTYKTSQQSLHIRVCLHGHGPLQFQNEPTA